MKDKKKIIIISFIIIGIVSIILLGVFKLGFSNTRISYYEKLLTKISDQGEDYFINNDSLPKEDFYSEKVYLNTLIKDKYISEILDYNDNKCSDKSYVIVVKKDKEYVYHSCLVCSGDNYSNMDDNYCDSAWEDNSTIGYGIDNDDFIYVNKGISKEELELKLEKELLIVKRNNNGKIIDTLNKKTDIKIKPKNINSIDVNKVGEYLLEYEYDGYVYQNKLKIYENPSPKVTVGYINKVYGGKEESGYLKEGDWAQKIVLTFNKGDSYNSEFGDVLKYQWYKDGKWSDICKKKDPCVVEITEEMNGKVKFRSVDVNNNYSAETKEYLLKIDRTSPDCELVTNGTIGNNDWYISNVKISFKEKNDKDSGTKLVNIINNKKDINRKTNINEVEHKTDSDSVIYYGYVEDNAGNYNICNIKFKKDTTKPECKSSGDSTKWINTNREIIYGCSDTLSGCLTNDEKYVFDYTTKTGTIPEYTIVDKAGNSNTCEKRVANVYVDKTNPECKYDGESTTWTKLDRTISYGCSDTDSGCSTKIENKTFNKTTKVGVIPSYTIKDKAGNTTTCEKHDVNVYVDKDRPTCTVEKIDTDKESGVDVKIICSDSDSGCEVESINKFNLKIDQSFNVKDSVGNIGTCSVQISKQILRRDANCSIYNTCKNSECGYEEYDCSDCKTGKNTCVPGIDYGKWGMCSLTLEECKKIGNNECEVCGNEGYYHSRDLINNPCKTGENTCKYGCSKREKTCSTKTCGCSTYGSFGDYYNVSSCKEETTNIIKTECKTVYK